MRTAVVMSTLGLIVLACSSDGAGNGPSAHCNNFTPVVADATTCVLSLTGCSDGHRYDVVCAGSSCKCGIDFQTTATVPAVGCDASVSKINASCGWNLQH